MAVRAIPGEFAVEADEVEARFGGVIESGHIEATKVLVTPLVFGVTHGAIARGDLAVNPLFGLYAKRNLVVTNEAAVAIDVEIGVVAVVATFRILEALVRKAEVTGHEIDFFVLGEKRRRTYGQNPRHQNRLSEQQNSDRDLLV